MRRLNFIPALIVCAIAAPAQPGRYGFQWRLVQDGVQWLGAMSTFQAIEVVPAPPPPVLSSQPP